MSTTLETAPAPTTSSRAASVRYYRLAVLVLGVALAAMIAVTVYLAVRSNPAADQATIPPPSGTSQVDQCFRPAVPC
jgi:hypothetical protein